MAAAKRFHVTTFGCQMNEHDSERMKGMLESLGYAEAPAARRGRPHPLQHVLDPRGGRQPLRRPPAPGQGRQARAARRRHRRRRLLGAVGQGRRLPPVPVRRRRLRPGPGPQARRVPDLRLAHRAGLLRVRGLHRPPAGQARPRVPGVGADLGRLQLPLLVLHRALHARARGLAPVRRARRGGPRARSPTACARSRCSARTSTPTGATCVRTAARSPSCCTRSTPSTGSTACATRARTPRTCARTSSAPTPSSRSVCEHIHLPLQSGSSAILKAMRRTYDRGRYLDRVALIREHVPDCAMTTDIIVGFPGETEEDFAQTLEVCEEVGYDGAFTFIFSPRRGTEAATHHRGPRAARGQGGADGAPRRGRPAARARARAALRRAHARRARRGPVAHRRLAHPRALAPRQDRELHRPGRAGRDRAGRDPLGHEHDAGRRGVAALARGGVATRWRAWRSSASAPSARPWPPPCSARAATSCCSARAGRSSGVVVELPDGSAVDGRRAAADRSRRASTRPPTGCCWRSRPTRRRARRAGCRRCAPAATTVAVLQNGIDHVERVGPLVGDAQRAAGRQLVPGRAGGAGPRAPARRLRLAVPAGRRGRGSRRCWATTPRSPSAAPSRCEAWRKLCANAVSGVMALAGRPAEIFALDDVREVARALAHECAAVARAEGVELTDARRRRGHRLDRGAARRTPAPRSSPTASPAAPWSGRRATA